MVDFLIHYSCEDYSSEHQFGNIDQKLAEFELENLSGTKLFLLRHYFICISTAKIRNILESAKHFGGILFPLRR